MARVHRRKPAYEGNPEIPIRVDVLRAAMEAFRWGPSELARATGDTQQTISALVNSSRPDRRCRADRARRIAKALQIPFEWLTEGVWVPPVHPVVWSGYEFRYSARTEFAASRLLTRCAQTCQRDVERERLESTTGLPAEMFVGQVLGLIAELIQVGRWRHWLLHWNPGVQERRGYTEPASLNPFAIRVIGPRPIHPEEPPFPPGARPIKTESLAKPQTDAEHEAAIVSLCGAIEHLLAPWFDGEAKLNYAALYRLTALPGAMPEGYFDPYSPTAAIPSASVLEKPGGRPGAAGTRRPSRSRPNQRSTVKRRTK